MGFDQSKEILCPGLVLCKGCAPIGDGKWSLGHVLIIRDFNRRLGFHLILIASNDIPADIAADVSILFLDIFHPIEVFEVFVLCPEGGVVQAGGGKNDAVCHCQF